MSDERVTTIEEAIESGWSAWSDTAESVKHRESMRLEWQAYRAALASLAADAAETQKLREHAEKMEATARWEHHEREVVRSYADHVEAERDAAVADRDRLAEAAHDLNEYASNKAGYWQHPLTEKVRAYFAALAEREGSDDA